jgi:hypothetical protein
MLSAGTLAVALLAALPAFAQTAQEHEAHHPNAAGAAPSPPSASPSGDAVTEGNTTGPAGMMGPDAQGPGMMGPGTMMGGDMMEGMRRMMGMMSMMSGMRSGASHIEGRLAFLKAELKIADAQAPQWNAFADTVRDNAKSMAEAHQSTISSGAAMTLPERLALEEKALTAHLEALKKTASALDELYDTLSVDQKKIADEIIVGPMGMM